MNPRNYCLLAYLTDCRGELFALSGKIVVVEEIFPYCYCWVIIGNICARLE